jgi:hypothetical protein
MTVKGWGVTMSLLALAWGFQHQHYGLFLVAALSGLAFWLLEGVVKQHQMRFYMASTWSARGSSAGRLLTDGVGVATTRVCVGSLAGAPTGSTGVEVAGSSSGWARAVLVGGGIVARLDRPRQTPPQARVMQASPTTTIIIKNHRLRVVDDSIA